MSYASILEELQTDVETLNNKLTVQISQSELSDQEARDLSYIHDFITDAHIAVANARKRIGRAYVY